MYSSFAHSISYLRRAFVEYSNARLEENGLTHGLLYFMLYVGRHPNCSQKHMARALGMDAGHTTRSVAKLEAEGMLCREIDPNDQRAYRLRLTEKGEQVFRMSHDLLVQWEEEILGSLEADERKALYVLIHKVIVGWEENRRV